MHRKTFPTRYNLHPNVNNSTLYQSTTLVGIAILSSIFSLFYPRFVVTVLKRKYIITSSKIRLITILISQNFSKN